MNTIEDIKESPIMENISNFDSNEQSGKSTSNREESKDSDYFNISKEDSKTREKNVSRKLEKVVSQPQIKKINEQIEEIKELEVHGFDPTAFVVDHQQN